MIEREKQHSQTNDNIMLDDTRTNGNMRCFYELNSIANFTQVQEPLLILDIKRL